MNTVKTQNAPGLSHHGAKRNKNSDSLKIAQLTPINQELAPQNVRETIAWLLSLGRPPLPENPIEAAKQGKEPKQPCFLDNRGYFKSVNWKHWQNTQPNQEIIDAWFCHPKTGIGTLGGWNGKHWLGWTDFDQKDFASKQECDREIGEWKSQYPAAQNAPMFRTPSGGYRFLFAFEGEPQNFKANSGFSLKLDGSHHCGELLCKNGGHTLLPPTVGLNGEAYQWVQWSEYPPVVGSPEEIGLYPVIKKTSVKASPSPKLYSGNSTCSTNGVSTLSDLLENEIYPRLDLQQAFNWDGHDFQQHGDKLKGNCPWHDSQSGTAFYCERTQNALLWRCPACNIGGSVLEYRHRLRGGNGSPRGREFVDLVRELADEVGVAMPDRTIQREVNSEGDAFRAVPNGYGGRSHRMAKVTGAKETGKRSPEKLRLDLQLLASETDPIVKAFRKQEIAETYRIRIQEIDKLAAQVAAARKPLHEECMSLDQLFSMAIPDVAYLVPGLLPVGESVLLAADPKCGKSLLAYDLAFAVATGEDYFLGEKCKQGKVLVVQTDESQTTARSRLLKRGFRPEDGENVHFMGSFNLSRLHELEKKLEDFKPSLVIIDSLKRITSGSELSENSAEFADNIYLLKEMLGRYGASGILVHHTNKSNESTGVGRVRGSSSISGATWGIWLMSQIPVPDPNNAKRMRVDPTNPTRIFEVISRDSEGQILKIELDPENNHWINHGKDGVTPEQQASDKCQQERIIEFLVKNAPIGFEASEISEKLAISKPSCTTQLSRLVEKRIIGRRPSNRDRRRSVYYIAPDNPQHLEAKKDNPPPPPLPEPGVMQYAETYIQQGLQDTQQIYNTDDKLHNTYALKRGVLCNSEPCTATALEIDNKNPQQGGGVGVIDFEGYSKNASVIDEISVSPLPEKIEDGMAKPTAAMAKPTAAMAKPTAGMAKPTAGIALTPQELVPIESWETQDGIDEAYSLLSYCDSLETVREVIALAPRKALEQGMKLLPEEKQLQIQQWLNEIDAPAEAAPFSQPRDFQVGDLVEIISDCLLIGLGEIAQIAAIHGRRIGLKKAKSSKSIQWALPEHIQLAVEA